MNITNVYRDDFLEQKSEWEKCIAFAKSEKAVHDGTTLYLPQLSGQEDDAYTAMVQRTMLSMFFKKVVKTYVGMGTRKPVEVTDADSVEEFLSNVTGTGVNFNQYVSSILDRFFTTGRVGTLVDLPLGGTNANPYFATYNEVDIPYWSEAVIDGVKTLVSVILVETVLQKNGNKYETATENQYRVLNLEDGIYTVDIYDTNGNMVGDTLTPLIDNKPLDYIPFIFHGGVDIQAPYLTEIVDANLHHYMLSADHFHALHWIGIPQPYVTGVTEAPETIGASVIWPLPEGSEAGFMEYEGKGLSEISDKLKVIEETIATLAINLAMNTEERTATEANIDEGNTTASLSGTLGMISNEFTMLLTIACDWMRKECGVVKINTDFVTTALDSQMLMALLQTYLQGGMSLETLLWNIKRGELMAESKSAEQEQTDIENGTPAGIE